MNRDAWRSLKKSLFFTTEDVADKFGITRASAHVLCSRQVKNGALIRLKKDFYVLEERWPYLDRQDFFVIANYLQVPSYISCTTALVYYGLTTQAPRRLVRKRRPETLHPIQRRRCDFFLFQAEERILLRLYENRSSFSWPQKEKAFLDACHLSAYGRYAIDLGRPRHGSSGQSRDWRPLMAPFPERTRKGSRTLGVN